MVKIVAIANQKGGVGKTTTAINVCAYCAQRYPTLLVDMDSQANATASLGVEMGERPSVHDVLVRGLDPNRAILQTRIPGLDLLPASPTLVAADLELASLMSREYKLKRAFQELGDKYRYVFIDCPPALSLLTLNAFAAAHTVLVTVQCEYLALEGLSELLTTIELARANLNPQLELGGVIMTMYDRRVSLSEQMLNAVRDQVPCTFKTVIPRNIRAAEAPLHGKSIVEYAPKSTAALAYKALAEEILTALGD